MHDMQAERHWTIEKKVPLALLLAIAAQTGGAFWWASSTNERLNSLERQFQQAAPQALAQADRLTRVEVKLETVKEGISEIKALIRREPTTTRSGATSLPIPVPTPN